MNQILQKENTSKPQLNLSEFEPNHFMNTNLETIEKRDEVTSCLELNLANKSKDSLIERLCSKNTKYRELIKLIVKTNSYNINSIGNNDTKEDNNNNTDDITQNIINMLQSKPNSLQSKMSKSKFSFLYNEINSMCAGKNPQVGNEIKTPPNYNSNYQKQYKPPIPAPVYMPMTIDKQTKTAEIEPRELKRTMSSNGALSLLRLPNILSRTTKGDFAPWTIRSSSSSLNNDFQKFKRMYTLPSLKLSKTNYISSFSSEYFANELNKFSSRLHRKGNSYNNSNSNSTITLNQRKYKKKNKKSIFSLLKMDN